MKTSEKVLTFAAIFISCLALIVSILQTRILQKQSYASVWPRLSNGVGQGLDYYNYNVHNDGVGPALISEVNYVYKDTSFVYINKLIHYFGKLESAETNRSVELNFSYSNIAEGDVITDRKEIEVFRANDSISVLLGKKYLSKTIKQIKYCSIYDDCWFLEDSITKEL